MQGIQGPQANTNVRYLIVVYDSNNNILETKRLRSETDIEPYIYDLKYKYVNMKIYIEIKEIIKIY